VTSSSALDPSTPSTAAGSRPTAFLVVGAIVFALAAIVGAYLDWLWWPVAYGGGLILALAAAVFLLVGGIATLVGRGIVRRVAFLVLVVGIGMVAGLGLGPSREPLIQQFGGTMTMHLTSPVVGVATGAVDCTNVASATEFDVAGDPNMRLDTSGSPFVSVYANVGDRWRVLSDAPRKDGIRLSIGITGALVTNAGKPGTVGMQADGSSIVESRFSNGGGSIRFGHLVAQTGPDFTGESMDLAGTLDWTCGPASP
jgi:hypothetical protein